MCAEARGIGRQQMGGNDDRDGPQGPRQIRAGSSVPGCCRAGPLPGYHVAPSLPDSAAHDQLPAGRVASRSRPPRRREEMSRAGFAISGPRTKTGADSAVKCSAAGAEREERSAWPATTAAPPQRAKECDRHGQRGVSKGTWGGSPAPKASPRCPLWRFFVSWLACMLRFCQLKQLPCDLSAPAPRKARPTAIPPEAFWPDRPHRCLALHAPHPSPCQIALTVRRRPHRRASMNGGTRVYRSTTRRPPSSS